MTTKTIGIKKFRANITNIWKEAREKNIKYIVMHYSTPIFEVNPIAEGKEIEEVYSQNILDEIKEGQLQIGNGKFVTEEELYKSLGIKYEN